MNRKNFIKIVLAAPSTLALNSNAYIDEDIDTDNTIPLDLYLDGRLDLPAEISFNDAVMVMLEYEEDDFIRLLEKCVGQAIKEKRAEDNGGLFEWEKKVKKIYTEND